MPSILPTIPPTLFVPETSPVLKEFEATPIPTIPPIEEETTDSLAPKISLVFMLFSTLPMPAIPPT